MLFNSFSFLWFFLAVYAVYLVLPFRWRLQNLFLIAAGYFFYGSWDWRFVGLLALSTVIDYSAGLGLGRVRGERARRVVLGSAIVCNLTILGFFKYFNFFAESLTRAFEVAGLRADLPTLQVILPVGISFYTFQSMAYAIDVYRRKIPAERNFIDYALYVAFFPQLMAGPIERAWHMLPQISRPRTVRTEDLARGGFLVLVGLFKKVCIADNLAPLVQDGFAAGPDQGAAGMVVAVVGFALQVYGDFSGYSDMARGLARLLGFDIIRNFNVPYAARSASEFWRRWHISLSTWLRDYVYIPLGGNRKGSRRQAANLMATMVLCGLWHGASWTFVIWGAYLGAVLIGYHTLGWPSATEDPPPSAPARWGQAALNFAFFTAGLLLFRAEGMGQAAAMLAAAVRLPWSPAFGGGGTVSAAIGPLALAGGCLALLDRWTLKADDDYFIRRWGLAGAAALTLLLLYAVIILGSRDENEFVYFQF